jgi:small-conductance mechanosensitive channel
MSIFGEILTYTFLGNSLKEYLIALAIFILTIVVLKLFKKVGIAKLKKMADHTRMEIDDLIIKIIESIGWPFYVVLALWISFQSLHLPEKIGKYFSFFILILIVYYLVKAIQEFINFGTSKLVKKREKEGKKIDTSAIKLLNNALKAVVWLIAILIVLQNLGFDITTLIAGLGIGGLAIALALQAVLGDILSCFSIYFDKPFEIGDFIIAGDDLGTVKKIGIKSTRIQSLWGEEIVISNKELTETRVRNYKKLKKRRIEFAFGVTYETPTKKLEKIPNIVKDIISQDELTQLDRVHFQKFGDFSLVFDVVYYVLTPDYNKYMDIQQEINFALKERFEKEGIEFAYPTQTIFLNKETP